MRQFAVIGLGRFGSSVAEALGKEGCEVLGIDIDAEVIQRASEYVTNAVCVDATDDRALRAVGIENVDVAIVSIGTNLEASILVTLILKEIGIPEIISKAITPHQGTVLERIGATRVIFPERDMGVRLAKTLVSPKILEQIDFSKEYSILETISPRDFIGRSLRDLDIRGKYGITVIGIKRKDALNLSPAADTVIENGDSLVIIGKNTDIEKFKKIH